MAVYKVQHIYHSTSGLPKDDIVNTMHFADGDGPDPLVAAAIAGRVAAAFYDANNPAVPGDLYEEFISNQISRVLLPTIKVYNAEAEGSPLAIATQAAMRASQSNSSMATETALAVTYHADLTGFPEEAPDGIDADGLPDRPRQRRRNRMYLGPFNLSALNSLTGRPETTLQACALDLVRRLSLPFAAPYEDVSLVIWSTKMQDMSIPVAVWCDNAFDTQRRRGVAPTGRTTLAL